MSASRPTVRVRPSAASVIVALVVLFGQAAAWVHAAATPHVTCLEHGDSVHLAVARTADPATRVDRDAVIGSPAEGSEAHGHEHCSVRAERVAAPGVPPVDATAALIEPDVSAAIVVATPPSHLLLLAPKTSPPRAPVA